MIIRDIQHHLASMIGTELSHETISKITDQVADEVLAWQTRPLEALYPTSDRRPRKVVHRNTWGRMSPEAKQASGPSSTRNDPNRRRLPLAHT